MKGSARTTGLHHVAALTRRVQANVDFYAGFPGLRLVKQTAGLNDSAQLHLFHGDVLGSPGSLVTFLAREDGAQGRTGPGQPAETALAVPPFSIGDWLTRAMAAQVPVEGPSMPCRKRMALGRKPCCTTASISAASICASRAGCWSNMPTTDRHERR